ncbi:MAG: hypothetical protein PW788_04830 [Micavibrio sp.]|nr:hypothetical protein [Micavibrio sp.]
MKRLQEVFNDAFSMDRLKGTVMGASAGYLFTGGQPAGLALGAVTGYLMGAERLTDTFQAAVQGREMALATVEAAPRRVARAFTK